ILDGEIVALDEKGRPSFQLLQNYKGSAQRVPLVYYAFDLLFLEGKTCVKNQSSRGANCLLMYSRKHPRTSGSPTACRVQRMIWSTWPGNSASKAWLPSDFPRSTKAAGAAAPGSSQTRSATRVCWAS